MNKVNFEQTGGFPLETNTFSFLQTAYGSLAGLAGLGGQNYILNGCEVVGANVSNGTVVIAGEVLPFTGGAKLARVIIEEIVTEKTFEDGVSKPVYTTRTAKMAGAGGVLDFDSLKRVSNLLDIADRIKDQEVVQWTPTIDPTYGITISGAKGYMYRMGKLIVLTGSLSYVYTVIGTQTAFSIGSLPFNTFTADTQYGISFHRDVTNNGEIITRPCYKNSEDTILTLPVSAPQGTNFSLNFSITLFTI